MLLFLLYF